MKHRNLIHIYMFYIILAMSALMVLNLGWSIYRQRQIARVNMLSQAQLIAKQFISVRAFIAAKQDVINYDSHGNFEFKFLNPAAVGRGVADIFNEKTEYTFKQTRLEPRNPANLPDAYETEQIKVLQNAPAQEYLWSESIMNETRVFRYIVPLYAEKECLACHGSPAGEPDVSGYLKEGLAEGDFAGVLSIAVNAQPYYDELYRNIGEQVLFTLSLLAVIVSILYILQRKLITEPLEGLTAMTVRFGQGDFTSVPSIKGQGEIGLLEECFVNMARELSTIYKDLERKVKERTAELEEEKEKLKNINAELHKMNQLQSEFLASVSHELRTPLSCILAFIELLESPDYADQREQNLADLKSSSQTLLNMINNLLDTAKLEAGVIEPIILNHQAESIVKETIQAFMPLAKAKMIVLNADIGQNLPLVLCDKERVRQILINLIGNAIKFTPDGGTITVRVHADRNSSHIVFSVEDTGPGISEAEQGIIFKRFRQGDVSINKKNAGSGLGLYLAKGLIEIQGGELGLVSKPGQGSVFWFRLPSGGIDGDKENSDC